MGTHIPFEPTEFEILNNFFTRFAWGDRPNQYAYPEGSARASMRRKDRWNKVNRIRLEEAKGEFSSEEFFLTYLNEYSDRYLAETPAEFFATIDSAAAELGISLEDITRHLNATIRGGTGETINAPLKPIYQVLRVRGYNWKDLAA